MATVTTPDFISLEPNLTLNNMQKSTDALYRELQESNKTKAAKARHRVRSTETDTYSMNDLKPYSAMNIDECILTEVKLCSLSFALLYCMLYSTRRKAYLLNAHILQFGEVISLITFFSR